MISQSNKSVIRLHARPDLDRLDVAARLEGVVAILRAIEAGELLAALPDCQVAQRKHIDAQRLLLLAERELMELHADLA